MPLDLAALAPPATTAIVTSECQVGVVGQDAIFPDLATAAAPTLPVIAQLVTAGRSAGVQVVHCLAVRRPDGKGANSNARLFAAAARAPVPLDEGSAAAALVPEIGPHPDDLVLTRLHGLNPMAGTDLDALLRNLGVRTVVVAGVSVNVAITNLVMDAVNAGYQVVIPRDAVAGTPAAYADLVLENTLALLATITTVEAITRTWRGGF